MDLKEKRKQERQSALNIRKSEIIEAAKGVFDEFGIENAKMTDIADRAEVGIASVYRYFNTKPELVIEVGIDYWHKAAQDIESRYDEQSGKCGLDKLIWFMDILIEQYKVNPSMVRFLEFFDFYFKSPENFHERLDEFESKLSRLHVFVIELIDEGIYDGSIRKDICSTDEAVVIVRSIGTLIQRFLTRDHILKMDYSFDPDRQLSILREMVIFHLKNFDFRDEKGGNNVRGPNKQEHPPACNTD